MTVQESVDDLNMVEDKSKKLNNKTDKIEYGLDFRSYNV